MSEALQEELIAWEELAKAATPQNLDSAQLKTENNYVECPYCNGDGEIYCETDYLNYDNAALGVQFYGIGKEHVSAEAYFRHVNPAFALDLIQKVRAALQPTPESGVPERPKLTAAASCFYHDVEVMGAWTANAHFDKLESMIADLQAQLKERKP